MSRLALKIPPLIVLVIMAAIAYLLSKFLPVMMWRVPIGLPMLIAVLGVGVAVLGVREFKHAKTTINPLNPSQSSQIVQSGIFGKTRNPMYLGMTLVLCAWVLWLGGLSSWLGVLAFVIYMTKFQIIPEEQILGEKFGDEFEAYCQRVRRWM